MQFVTTLAITLLAASAPDPDFLELYKPLEFHYTGGRYEDQVFHYRLLDPRTDDSGRKFPLLVWLHGLGESGDDNVSQLRYFDTLLTPEPWRLGRFPFFVLALQAPRDNASWSSGQEIEPDHMLAVLVELLDKTLAEYPIDRDRVYLSGVSSGGSGCWRFACQYPEYFAAVAPLSGGGFSPTPEQVAALRPIPIWAFNCTEDQISQIPLVRRAVRTLDEAGVKIHLTEFESASHDSWTSAFNDYDLRGWLLAQRRGDASAPPPGHVRWYQAAVIFYRGPFSDLFRGWSWMQISALGFLAAVVVAIGNRPGKRNRFFPKIRLVRRRSRPVK